MQLTERLNLMSDSLFALTAFNEFFQNLGSWLTLPMEFFSFLWREEFIMLLLPAIYWCWDAAFGFRLSALLMFGNAVNSIFKLAFHAPRPYWINPEIQAYSAESSFGMPSGHAQNSTLLWGRLAVAIRRKWVTAVFVFIILMIGISRIYLGVHFISDVVVGWLIGAVLLWAALRLEKPIAAWLGPKSVPAQIAWALLFALLVILLGIAARLALAGWQMPVEWAANASLQAPDEPTAPFALEGIVTASGTWWGMAAGYAWYTRRFGRFDAGGDLSKRALRFSLGLIVVLILWFGLGQIFPRNEDVLSFVLRFARYALLGAWVSAGAPWVFVRLKLANGPALAKTGK